MSISAVIGLSALWLFLAVWYPGSYFRAAGADELTLLLIGVDICVGPLLTFIVFVPGKRGLKFDLVVIAIVQLGALAYGSSVVAESRPVFLVGVLDRFVLISANEISDDDLAQGGKPEFRTRSWIGPRLVLAEQPNDEKIKSDLAFSALAGRDLQNLPSYYRDFPSNGAELLRKAGTIDALIRKDPAGQTLVESALKHLGRSPDQVRWLPLEARKLDMTMLVDAKDATPLQAVPVDPW